MIPCYGYYEQYLYILNIETGSKPTYPKLPIVTKIKICKYNKTPDSCCAFQGRRLQLLLSPYSQPMT
jgi:hypothetical protein